MKKVFILIVKHYFKENGVDYAASIDNNEIFVLSDKESAESVRKDFISRVLEDNPHYEKIVPKNILHNNVIILQHDCWRDCYEIIEKNLC